MKPQPPRFSQNRLLTIAGPGEKCNPGGFRLPWYRFNPRVGFVAQATSDESLNFRLRSANSNCAGTSLPESLTGIVFAFALTFYQWCLALRSIPAHPTLPTPNTHTAALTALSYCRLHTSRITDATLSPRKQCHSKFIQPLIRLKRA